MVAGIQTTAAISVQSRTKGVTLQSQKLVSAHLQSPVLVTASANGVTAAAP